jgi:hypothetical protein
MAKQSLVGQGFVIVDASRSHSDDYIQSACSGRVISSTQRPIPDNTQHSQETYIHAPSEYEPATPAINWPQTHVLDRSAAAIDCYFMQTFINISTSVGCTLAEPLVKSTLMSQLKRGCGAALSLTYEN